MSCFIGCQNQKVTKVAHARAHARTHRGMKVICVIARCLFRFVCESDADFLHTHDL